MPYYRPLALVPEQNEEGSLLAHVGQGVGHGLAAFQQRVQPVRLLLQELHRLHLHSKHHPHLALQAGELVYSGYGAEDSGKRQGRLLGRR